MKLECLCGFDTQSHEKLEVILEDLERKGGCLNVWYEDDFENKCPQCGENGLRLIEN